jgi:membrane protein DedA with SNARE-associated domain
VENFIIDVVNQGGYAGVFLLMFLETVFPPVPSEVIMPIAGIAAARGHMNIGGVVASGTAGAMLGNFLWYYVAWKLGQARLKPFIEKNSRWLTMDWAEVERGERLFQKYGSLIVMVARILPTLRSLISVPAGLFKLRLGRFLVFSTIGTALWTSALAGAGYVLGRQFKQIETIIGPLSIAVIAAIILSYIWRLWRWKPEGIQK